MVPSFATGSKGFSRLETETIGARCSRAPMPASRRSSRWTKRRTIRTILPAAPSSNLRAWCNRTPRRALAARRPLVRRCRKRLARDPDPRSPRGEFRTRGSRRYLRAAWSESRHLIPSPRSNDGVRFGRREELPRVVADHIAGAAHGVQERLRKALVDLGSQSRNVHVDDVGLRIEMVVPDILQQHRPGDNLAGMAHEIFQQAEFARLKLQFLPGAAHLVRKPVELEIGNAVKRFLAAATAPARQHLDACKQFRERVGLRQIVVAARAQAFDAVVDLAKCREDKHR